MDPDINNQPPKPYGWLILLIVLVGFGLRFLQFYLYADLNRDQGRDLLVARHIAVFDESTSIGHPSEIPGSFYPPYYYYMLAGLTRLSDEPASIYLFVILLSSLSIYAIYLAGKNFFNHRVGFYCAIFFGLSPWAISASTIWSTYVMMPIFIFCLYLFSVFIKTKKTIHLALFVFLYGLVSFSSFSYIFFLPIFFVFSLRERKVRAIKVTLIWALNFILMASPTIFYLKDQLLPVFLDRKNFLTGFSTGNLFSIIGMVFGEIYGGSRERMIVGSISTAILLLLTGIFLIRSASATGKKKNMGIFVFLGLFIGGILIAQLKIGVKNYQLVSLLPIYFLLIGGAIDFVISSKHKTYQYLLAVFFLLVIADYGFVKNLMTYKSNRDANKLIMNSKVADIIALELRSEPNQGEEFDIFSIYPDSADRIRTPEYYYLLEKINGKRYVEIAVREDLSFKKLTPNKNGPIFLLCWNFNNPEEANSGCVRNFISENADYKAGKVFFRKSNIIGYKLLKL